MSTPGSTSSARTRWQGRFRRSRRASRLTDRVTFHGFRPTDELVPLFQRSHLFVLIVPPRSRGAVVLEAAACGVPVAGTAVGYLADWAPDRAVAVPTRNPDALARAIEALLANPAQRRQLAVPHAAGCSLMTWNGRPPRSNAFTQRSPRRARESDSRARCFATVAVGQPTDAVDKRSTALEPAWPRRHEKTVDRRPSAVLRRSHSSRPIVSSSAAPRRRFLRWPGSPSSRPSGRSQSGLRPAAATRRRPLS